MNSRTEQTWTQSSSSGNRTYGSSGGSSRDLGSAVADSMTWMTDQMIRWPFWMTTASMQLMLDGMQRMTGGIGGRTGNGGTMQDASDTSSGSGGSTSVSRAPISSNQGSSWVQNLFGGGQHNQDLSGNDLKYVVWSIIFTKPQYECVLEHHQDELINYDTDGSSFAALKIAKFLEKARHGKADKPPFWGDRNYPPEPQQSRRQGPEAANRPGEQKDKEKDSSGWRIPAEDQKYIHFLYRVERRLPKQEMEVTRVERVTTVHEERSNQSAVA